MTNYSICARQNPQNEERGIKYYANAQSVNNLDMTAFAKRTQSQRQPPSAHLVTKEVVLYITRL